MSFANMKLEDLQKVAHFFELEITERDKKADIINKLQESGKTYAMYKKFTEQPAQTEEADVHFSSTILLKMSRQNPSFEVFGYRFSRTHPYQVMPQEDAQKIMDTYEGFVIASPDEARSFYA